MQWIIAVTALFLIPSLILTWFTAGSLVAAHPQVVGDAPADLPAISISLYSESGSCLAGWHIRSSGRRGVIVLVHPYRGCRLVMVNRALDYYIPKVIRSSWSTFGHMGRVLEAE